MNNEPSMYPDIQCPGMSGQMSGTQNHLTPDITGGTRREACPGMSGVCDGRKKSESPKWAALASGARVLVFKGQVFEPIAKSSCVNRAGETVPLFHVRAFCTECDEPFETTATGNPKSVRRRCFACSPKRAPPAPSGWLTLENVR